MRRVTILTLGILAIAGLVTSVAQASPTPADVSAGRTIRLTERIHDVQFVDEADPGASLGDRLVFTGNLFDQNGRNVGRDGADCVVVRLEPSAPPDEQQVVNCQISVELSDGEITFQGLAQGLDNTFAITGGTGAYQNARGQALARDTVFLQEAEIEINVIG